MAKRSKEETRHRHSTGWRKAAWLALGITLLLHFFTLLLAIGYNAFNSPSVIQYDPTTLHKPILFLSLTAVFIYLFVQFLVAFRIQGESRNFRVGWLTGGVLLTALIYGWLIMLINETIFDFPEALSVKYYLGTLVSNGFLSLVVLLLTYVDFMNKKQERTALENESLRAQNIQSRYEALQKQIDPHFLFNTFSSLTSMIELDPAKAQEFSIMMSSVLRYTLQHRDHVTLGEELAFARDYCTLMQIRYDKNLIVESDIDEKYHPYYVVPLSIQTLIENAVKHNEISNRMPLRITARTNNDATLTVSNGINPKRSQGNGTRLGLTNLSERYMLRWEKKVQIYSGVDLFSVTIPLIKPDKEQEK